MSKIIDFITNFIPITGNSTIDSIIFFVICGVAFVVAWITVGFLAPLLGFNPEDMSKANSIIQTITAVALTVGILKLIELIKWLCSFEWWVYLIVVIVLAHLVAGITILYIRHKKKNEKDKDQVE